MHVYNFAGITLCSCPLSENGSLAKAKAPAAEKFGCTGTYEFSTWHMHLKRYRCRFLGFGPGGARVEDAVKVDVPTPAASE